MTKKLVTINVEDKDLVASKKVSEKKVETVKKAEIENFGIVEINNASSAKKVKSVKERGFEKNISGEEKKSVKSKTSQVEDYFDFSFRKNEQSKTKSSEKAETKNEKKSTKSSAVTSNSTAKKSEKSANLDKNSEKNNKIQQQVCFDSDANHVIRVARIGSLFDCDIKMMNA